MKKSIAMFLALLFVSVSAMAANLKVQPVVNVATFDGADTTTGVGLKASASNVLVDNVVIGTGVNFYDLGSADLYRVPVTVGYAYKVNDSLTVTPNVGAEINVVDDNIVNDKASLGFTAGLDVAFKVTENVNLVAGYSRSQDSINGTNLDGNTFSGGLTYSF